ncbi:MAG: VanZ family protein [Lachnospiraceae bacterium]|nr:VanZ family protein [Lachnospiraceae bacterium]
MSHVKTLVIMQLKSAFAYLPTGCTYAAGITCFLLVLCAVWKFYLHKKVPWLFWWRPLVGFLFITYMYCVLQLTIISREPGNYGAVDWRFLVRWNENDAQKAFLLANIIMFIPFGVLLPMFGKTMSHILIVLPIALACSVCIEALQLKYQLGFCQLDDVMANSVGFLIGFLIFLTIRDVYLFVVMLFRLFASIAKGGRYSGVYNENT